MAAVLDACAMIAYLRGEPGADKVSLADCFAMALTNRMQADLYTSDHHEFDPIAASGICSVKFIR